MAHVDALSRAVDDETDDVEFVDKQLTERLEVCIAMTKERRVRFMQQADEHSRKLIALLESGNTLTRQEMSESENFELKKGVLFRVYEGHPLLVVPKTMRKGILIEAHDYGGHFSVERTIARITADYWFTRLQSYVRQHINMCLDCLIHKRPAGKRPGMLPNLTSGKRPFQIIHVDHLGPFETSTSNNNYLFVLADNLTKYVHLYPSGTTDAADDIRIHKKFCDEWGIPDRIISDRGTCSTSRTFYEFCRDREITHTLNSTRHPQANGQVERANPTILLKKKFDLKSEQQKQGVIVSDEIFLKENICVNSRTLTYMGLEVFGEELNRKTNSSQRANRSLDFTWQSLADHFVQPIAVFASHGTVRLIL